MQRSRPSLLAVVLVGALALSACKRPRAEDCEEAIRNWFSLIYWEDAEKEIAAAPPDQRDALRAAKLADRDKKLEAGLELSINQCRAARDFDGVKCMKAARTAAQARACRPAK
ncbi:MAG TPA: hypothetical protein VHE35_16160 [Kofleriaceae bacterium]|nr:hypothetical protein [Kofleriaceae bacterium]